MKKILITGSSGFIGFSLTLRLLKKGYTILGYDSMNNYYDIKLKKSRNQILKKFKNFNFVKGELENQKKVFLKDFIKTIENNLNKKAIKNYMSMQKGDVKQTLSNTSLLQQLIRYKPMITYRTGIKKFINWYKNYYKSKS